jgi:hypothetical protein
VQAFIFRADFYLEVLLLPPPPPPPPHGFFIIFHDR